MAATVLIGNSNVNASESSPIVAEKLQHVHKIIVPFDCDAAAGKSIQIGTRAKVGATAGWVVGAADNLPYVATLAASQTGATLVIPIDGLTIGDVITGFRVVAQVESAGGTVTIDGDLRATTNVAAEPTDASIGTMTQVSVTADTAVSQAKSSLGEIVTSGKTYYLKLTATTAAATDIILQACEVVVNGLRTVSTKIAFVCEKAGTITEVAAGCDNTGTSMAIAFDVIKRPATSVLSSPIALTHATGNRVEVTGSLDADAVVSIGNVIVAQMTITTAVGVLGPWVRIKIVDAGE